MLSRASCAGCRAGVFSKRSRNNYCALHNSLDKFVLYLCLYRDVCEAGRGRTLVQASLQCCVTTVTLAGNLCGEYLLLECARSGSSTNLCGPLGYASRCTLLGVVYYYSSVDPLSRDHVGGSYRPTRTSRTIQAKRRCLTCFVVCQLFGLGVGCLMVLHGHDLLSCTCIEGRIGNVCLVSVGAVLGVPDILRAML